MERKLFIIAHDLALHALNKRQCIAIDLDHLINRNRIVFGLKVGQIAEKEAQGVANTAVRLDHAL
jgi:hypothetical protein